MSKLRKLRKYSFSSKLKLFLDIIRTKLYYSKSRLIRFPFDIRNRNSISFGKNLTTGIGCRIEAYPTKEQKVLFLGDNIEINDYVHIAAAESVVISDNVLIASKVFITDISHGDYSGSNQASPYTIANKRKISTKPVLIGENVWIGESVCILPGITIGKCSIIGAGSIVTKNIPPFSIAVGNPIKVIKQYNFDTQMWDKV